MSTQKFAKALMQRQARDLDTGKDIPDRVSRLAGDRLLKLEEENASLKAMIKDMLIETNPKRGDWFLKADEYKLRKVLATAHAKLLRRAQSIHHGRRFWD